MGKNCVGDKHSTYNFSLTVIPLGNLAKFLKSKGGFAKITVNSGFNFREYGQVSDGQDCGFSQRRPDIARTPKLQNIIFGHATVFP